MIKFLMNNYSSRIVEKELNTTQRVARDSMDKFIPVLKNQIVF